LIKNCGQLGGWYIWNGKVWALDETHQMTRLARQTVNSLYEMAAKMAAPKRLNCIFINILKYPATKAGLRL